MVSITDKKRDVLVCKFGHKISASMIYIKNMYITCVVIDHRKNLTIHLSIGNQTYPKGQKIRKRTGRVRLRRGISNLSKQAERWKKEGEGHQTYLNRQNVEKRGVKL